MRCDNAVRQCGATMQYNVRYDNAVRQCMQYDMRYDVRYDVRYYDAVRRRSTTMRYDVRYDVGYYDAERRRSTTMRYENAVLRCSTTCGTTARCDDAVQYMTMYSVAPM